MSRDKPFNELDFLRREVKRLREALNILTPELEMLLKRRGFQVYKKEPKGDLLIPGPEYIDAYYQMLHKYSFRLFIRDIIKHQDLIALDHVTRYSTAQVTGGYLDFIARIGLTEGKANGQTLKRRPIKSFGETLEWYIAEVFRREFGSEALWGVKFRRPKIGGDYDVISKFNGSIFYVEVKSSPPKQIYDREIKAFFDRVSDLSPEIAVFLMDTELRMKDKIVSMFEDELRKRVSVPPEVVRMEKELFQIQDRIYIINAKDSITGNIEKVLNWYSRR
jgi:hypothetical protein